MKSVLEVPVSVDIEEKATAAVGALLSTVTPVKLDTTVPPGAMDVADCTR